MNVIDVRRENLKALSDKIGGVEYLAKYIGKSESQVNHWLLGPKSSETGRARGISTAACRHIEQEFGKPKGWMDVEQAKKVEKSKVVKKSVTLTSNRTRKSAKTDDWPFKELSLNKIRLLDEYSLGKLEAIVLMGSINLNLDVTD